jgi:hypothetical protein
VNILVEHAKLLNYTAMTHVPITIEMTKWVQDGDDQMGNETLDVLIRSNVIRTSRIIIGLRGNFRCICKHPL